MKFDNIKFDCSSLPQMMTSGRDRPLTEKQNAELERLSTKETPLTEIQEARLEYLSERKEIEGRLDKLPAGCITELKKVYVRERYGKSQVSISKEFTPQLLHGIASEHKSLELIEYVDGIKYKSNKKTISNKRLKGMIDAYLGKSVKRCDKVLEVKTAANMQSLMASIGTNDLRNTYYWQIMGYLAITGAEIGEIVHCVVNYPETLINQEIKRMIMKASDFGLGSDYIEKSIERIRFNMTFDEIPPEQRIVRYTVERDEDAIANIYERLEYCREWLNDFAKIHESQSISSITF